MNGGAEHPATRIDAVAGRSDPAEVLAVVVAWVFPRVRAEQKFTEVGSM